MRPKKFLLMAATLIVTLLFATVGAFAAPEGEVDWERAVIRATGYGVPNMRFQHPGQRKLSARDAARADAMRGLLEATKGVQVDAEVQVVDYMTQSQSIHLKVSGLVTGAQVVDEGWVDADSYYVTMEMPMYGVKSVASAVL